MMEIRIDMQPEKKQLKYCEETVSDADSIAREHLLVDLIANKLIVDLGTRDVYEIARRTDISVEFESWFPVTFGEFDRKNRRITVNRNAPVWVEVIVAHELGHYFLQDLTGIEGIDIERSCDRFANALLG